MNNAITAYLISAIHWLIVCVLTLRIVMRRPPQGVAAAWLVLIVTIPFGGALTYFLIGERRIGEKRTKSIAALRTDFRVILDALVHRELTEVDWTRHDASAQRLDLLGRKLSNSPTVRSNSLQLTTTSDEILRSMAADIDSSKTSVLMEFYIWAEGGGADDVVEAVIRAAGRGVDCRLLIDAIGARPWWKGKQPQRLRDAGVRVVPALPVSLFRTFVGRTDLRLHRKIVVIDGDVAWTGSMNLVDPKYFKQEAGVGEWVDAMVRVEGAAVGLLAATFVGDWLLETTDSLEQMVRDAGLKLKASSGTADVQVFPSGPGETDDGLLQMVIEAVNAADFQLTITTPYLVPDDSLLRALRLAAGRGVKVQLILPEKVDSVLTRYASRSYYDDLLNEGVEIYLFKGGLLHTKSIVADHSISMFGTVNMDMRSLWLNYEVALFIYDPDFAAQLYQLQTQYMRNSVRLVGEVWRQRSFHERVVENTLRLMSPLL